MDFGQVSFPYARLLILLLVGGLFILLVRKHPFSKWLYEQAPIGNFWRHFFRDMISCNLCLGVWIYFILEFLFKVNLIEFVYVPVISEFVNGAMISFIMWLLIAGWNTLFGTIEIS